MDTIIGEEDTTERVSREAMLLPMSGACSSICCWLASWPRPDWYDVVERGDGGDGGSADANSWLPNGVVSALIDDSVRRQRQSQINRSTARASMK